jgi:hypothetical protein
MFCGLSHFYDGGYEDLRFSRHWIFTLRSSDLVDRYQRFGGNLCLARWGGRFSRDVDTCPPNSTVGYNSHRCINVLKPTGYLMQWQVQYSKIVHSVLTAFMFLFVFISEQTANSDLCNINHLVFITLMKNAYCPFWNASLNKRVYASSLKG